MGVAEAGSCEESQRFLASWRKHLRVERSLQWIHPRNERPRGDLVRPALAETSMVDGGHTQGVMWPEQCLKAESLES